MFQQRFQELWQSLRGKKPHMPHFLDEVFLDGIRGISGLRVPFGYPVSVIAGENASGKSTVLFAAACAYKVKGAGVKDFVPSTLFPDFRPHAGSRSDKPQQVTLQFEYTTPEGKRSMLWRRGKGWNRSFLGRKNASQPERQLYLRTLSNLSNPSEVRGMLSNMARMASEPAVRHLNASQIQFARKVLSSFQYSEVVDLSSGKKRLLFATQEGGSQYSELHMAAGERTVLRLSQEIAQLDGALILIDEVETGLHPLVQKLLMLQLQQLALRNNLQIIVTSHSQVILNSVPSDGRIFLGRSDGGVTIQEPLRDIVQNALYGQSEELLNILCEDEVAEGVLQGILEAIRPDLGMRSDAIRVGRDTGAQQFPQYAKAFKAFGQIQNFVFVLDGDQQDKSTKQNIYEATKESDIPVLFLPGQHAPEVWVWDQIRARPSEIADCLGDDPESLQTRMANLDSIYDTASDTPSSIAKNKLHELAQIYNSTPPQLGRFVAKVEAKYPDSPIQPLANGLRDAIGRWRSL